MAQPAGGPATRSMTLRSPAEEGWLVSDSTDVPLVLPQSFRRKPRWERKTAERRSEWPTRFWFRQSDAYAYQPSLHAANQKAKPA